MDAKRQKLAEASDEDPVGAEEDFDPDNEGSMDEDDFDDGEVNELEACLTELQNAQDQLDKIDDDASDAVLAIEQKFNTIRRPAYKKRAEAIAAIPNFWLTAFCCHPLFAPCLTEADKEALIYLHEVDVQDNHDVKSGFVITFRFLDNPYFHDRVLTKHFNFAEDGTLTILEAKINWKPDMDVTKDDEDSFFKWFYVHECLPNGMQDEIATTIKEDLWSNPVKYFHGIGDEFDEDDDEEEEEGDENGDEEEEGAEFEEDEEGEGGEDDEEDEIEEEV
mmetsp:Transcript_17279/g.23881  ORF Transcript_17279/g.23881 Transcript_17279/m.23881 type:complete len:277 (-) Transcript_17279:172-1002(-)|eukprot:CAMPEP_0196572146 /NCGR_PEP_ID=MMETSP1081-20130531/2239_1 /TAXON_ID=36882 /ORGANISM="Pyramimonas amylifera, Strain CCMP720" /LENGTH=276 /DNA_ID=CAMNT_0041889355 /DNA_START=275 /DNA_END=1105 /DNA_ORIENTATION=-